MDFPVIQVLFKEKDGDLHVKHWFLYDKDGDFIRDSYGNAFLSASEIAELILMNKVPEGVEHIEGDRTSDSDLAKLNRYSFDIVIDTSGRKRSADFYWLCNCSYIGYDNWISPRATYYQIKATTIYCYLVWPFYLSWYSPLHDG